MQMDAGKVLESAKSRIHIEHRSTGKGNFVQGEHSLHWFANESISLCTSAIVLWFVLCLCVVVIQFEFPWRDRRLLVNGFLDFLLVWAATFPITRCGLAGLGLRVHGCSLCLCLGILHMKTLSHRFESAKSALSGASGTRRYLDVKTWLPFGCDLGLCFAHCLHTLRSECHVEGINAILFRMLTLDNNASCNFMNATLSLYIIECKNNIKQMIQDDFNYFHVFNIKNDMNLCL